MPRAVQPRPQATACMLHDRPGVQTVWLVEVPTTASAKKLYQATTYPNSKLLFLQGERGRTIAPGVATLLLPTVRAAVERAQAAQTSASQGATA
jgi:hypothetical protein